MVEQGEVCFVEREGVVQGAAGGEWGLGRPEEGVVVGEEGEEDAEEEGYCCCRVDSVS